MSDNTKASAEKREKVPSQKEGTSLEQRRNESREKAGAMALSAEARSETGDIVDSLPGGEISEVAREDNKKKSEPTTGGQSTQGDDDTLLLGLEEITPPPQKVMVRKVRVAIQEEIREVRTEVKKYDKKPEQHAFELSEKVHVLRKLYGLLQEIRYKSKEFVQNLWMHTHKEKKISDIMK